MNQTFEDFPVYNKILSIIQEIEELCNKSKAFQFNFIKDQIRRASSSILLNLAEGSVKWSKKDKINFYRMSCASASESIAAIDLFLIYKLADSDQINNIKKSLREIYANIQALIVSIQNREN